MNHPVILTLAAALMSSVAITFVLFLAFAYPILLFPVAISAVFPFIEATRPLFGAGRPPGGPSALPH